MENAAPRFKMIVCPYPLIVRDGKILLVRRKNTAYMPGWYSVPAGHEETDERLLDTLCREAAEEVGITVSAGDTELVHVMQRNEGDVRLDLFFLVKKWTGEPYNAEPEKCDVIGWFPLNSLPDHTVPYIKAGIEAWRNGLKYQELGWNSHLSST